MRKNSLTPMNLDESKSIKTRLSLIGVEQDVNPLVLISLLLLFMVGSDFFKRIWDFFENFEGTGLFYNIWWWGKISAISMIGVLLLYISLKSIVFFIRLKQISFLKGNFDIKRKSKKSAHKSVCRILNIYAAHHHVMNRSSIDKTAAEIKEKMQPHEGNVDFDEIFKIIDNEILSKLDDRAKKSIWVFSRSLVNGIKFMPSFFGDIAIIAVSSVVLIQNMQHIYTGKHSIFCSIFHLKTVIDELNRSGLVVDGKEILISDGRGFASTVIEILTAGVPVFYIIANIGCAAAKTFRPIPFKKDPALFGITEKLELDENGQVFKFFPVRYILWLFTVVFLAILAA